MLRRRDGCRTGEGLDTLGLRLLSEEAALVFQAGTTILRPSLVRAVPSAQHTALGWKVEDIDATVDGLVTRGTRGVVFEKRFPGFIQDERGLAAPDGTRIAWFRDPDGTCSP